MFCFSFVYSTNQRLHGHVSFTVAAAGDRGFPLPAHALPCGVGTSGGAHLSSPEDSTCVESGGTSAMKQPNEKARKESRKDHWRELIFRLMTICPSFLFFFFFF